VSDPRITPLCDYWVREDGRPQCRCGAPASHSARTIRGELFYCELHARVVRERTKDTIVPEPLRGPDEGGRP